MKLTKKIIAAVAALTMTMASAGAVFAAEDGTIEGGAEYINTTIYKLTLPTTAGISFTLDPQGLLTPGATGQAVEDLTGGDITGSGVMVAYSESSVDVTCSAAFYVEAPTSTAVTAAGSIASVPATKQAIGLQINYEVKQAGNIATDVSGASIADVTSPAQLDVTATSVSAASVLNQKLDKVSYVVTGNATDGFDYVKSSTGDAAILYMYVGGKVTTDADWSAYTKGKDTIKLKTVFTFKNAENADVSSGSMAYALDDLGEIWFALTPFGADKTAPTPGFTGATISDVKDLKVNGNSATGRIEDGYLVLGYDQAEAAVWNVTFTFNGVNYTATVS